MNKNEELMRSGNIWKAIASMCIPAMLITSIIILYNMADTFFVAKTGNEFMVAAVALVGAIYSVIMAAGQLVGAGGCTQIAIALGNRDYPRVKKMMRASIIICIVLGLIMAGVVVLLQNPILAAIGASAQTITYARDYLLILCTCSTFVILPNALANILRATGSNKEAMIGNFMGSIINIVLDPIMILVLGMGVKGAAIATIIGNLIATIYYLRFIQNNEYLRVDLKDNLDLGNVKEILKSGLPSAISTSIIALSSIVINTNLAGYSDLAVAAHGIAGKVPMIVSMLTMALAMGVQPLLAYNYGAGDNKRLNDIVRKIGLVIFAFAIVLTAGGCLMSEMIVKSFIDNPEIIEIGVKMVNIKMIGIPFVGFCYLATNVLQATNNASKASFISLLRQGFLLIPLIYVFALIFGMYGIVIAEPVADIVGTVVAMILMVKALRTEKLKNTD